MLSLLAAVALAATPQPRAAAQADIAVYVPRLDRLSGVVAFLQRAGQHSSLLHLSTWTDEFHPFLPVDPTRADSLTASGIDPSSSATVSVGRDGSITCTHLRDVQTFTSVADKRLAEFGEIKKSRPQGAALQVVHGSRGDLVGYALKGDEACSLATDEGGAKLADEAARLTSKPSTGAPWKSLATLPGAAYVVSRFGTAALEGNASELHVEGRTAQLPVPLLGSGANSPYAQMEPSGALLARAQVDVGSRRQAVLSLEAQLAAACRSCDEKVMAEIAEGLAEHLTGHVALRVDRVQPGKSLRTAAERFFSVKLAYLAELIKPDEVDSLLERVLALKGARKSERGYVLPVQGGELEIGRAGRHLFVGNDAEAIRAALAAVPAQPGNLAHGMVFILEPRRLARALSQVSLFDAMESRELASVFAAATELGPLLAASERVSGWAESAGASSHRVSVVWTLAPPRKSGGAPDGGR